MQSETVARVVELVVEHHRVAPATLFVCGTYTLGKFCIFQEYCVQGSDAMYSGQHLPTFGGM
jgi:hypothetical protein